MVSNTFKAVPAIFTDIHSALYHDCINLASQGHLPSWSQTPSRQYQQYWQIFTAPSITVALIFPYSTIYRQSSKIIIYWPFIVFMESNTFKAVPSILRDIHRALYHGCINLASQNHLPSLQCNHLLVAMHCFQGVKHLKGSTSNIDRYSQRPLSRLH